MAQWAGVECIVDKGGVSVPTLKCLEAVFKLLVTFIVSSLGIIFFVMLVIGALHYLLAGSDPKSAEAAKKTITYAIYGVVLVVASYLILRLIAVLTGVDLILTFSIPTE